METKTRTAAEIIETPQVGDKLRKVIAQKETFTHICTVEVVKIGTHGAVTYTLSRYTNNNGHEYTQVSELPRRNRARWLATNFTGYEAA